jgi:CRP-like cAMP-binding protein
MGCRRPFRQWGEGGALRYGISLGRGGVQDWIDPVEVAMVSTPGFLAGARRALPPPPGKGGETDGKGGHKVPLKVVPRRDRKLYRVVKRGEARRLSKGDVLYRARDPADHLFLVRAGHLRLIRKMEEHTGSGESPEGGVVALAGPWEIAGEEALFPDTPRRFTAVAGEPVQLTILASTATRGALQTSQKTLEAFLHAKEEELTLARILGEARRPGGAGLRLGALLLHLAARLGREEGKGILIPVPLTHQLLADLSHSHRSTVTTLLNDWIYAGILESGDVGWRILKPDGLRNPLVPLT